jgi:hypothetical protein
MLKATFQTIRQTTWKIVVGLLTAQARQKVEMEAATFKESVNQLPCLLLLAQAHLMKKLKAVRQIILAAKDTLKKLVCVATAQLKQTVGNSTRTLALRTHHHAK